MEHRLEIPEALTFLLRESRYKVAYGGRGSGKSWTFARVLLALALERKLRILCAREYQNSIHDSVHKLLSEQIDALGFAPYYEILQTTIRAANGSEFIFSGLRSNIQSIKSKEGIDIVWVEEAQTVSNASWSVLIPTIRKDGSEIWVSFNPEHEDDPTYERFVKNPPTGALVRKVGWEHNRWLPQVLREEKDHLYRVDPDAARHVWGGEPLAYSDAQVLRGRYSVQSFTAQAEWNGPYQGLDFGFAVSPMAFVRCWVHERKLFIEYEASGLEIDNDDLPAKLDTVPRAREYVTRCDSARPETISHLRRHGFTRALGCYKGKGSIEGGVEHLRSYEQIVIHPRCTLAIEQAKLYSFKVDKLSGDVKPDLEDKHNDIWDAVRYALEPIILRGKPAKVEEGPKPLPMDYRAARAKAMRQKRG